MLFIFPILFCFSFFIWSCSVLMMMQIVRCESAVAQGLRSDTLQATKKAASASMRPPPPSLPLACWLRTSPHSQPASLPNAPKSQTRLAFGRTFTLNEFQYSAINSCWLVDFSNCPMIWNHRLIPPCPPPQCSPLFWDTLRVPSVCQSGVAGVLPGIAGLQLSHLAIQRAQQRSNDLCQEQGHASSITWCIVVVVVARDTHTPRAGVCCACITGTITCTKCPAS